MHKKAFLLGGVLVAVLLVGMVVFAYLKKQEVRMNNMQPPVDREEVSPVTKVDHIDAKHYFTETPGVHTLTGEVALPASCNTLENTVVLYDVEGKTHARVSFIARNSEATPCEGAPTPHKFKVGFQGPKDLDIEAYYMGEPVALTLTEAGADEKPSDFTL